MNRGAFEVKPLSRSAYRFGRRFARAADGPVSLHKNAINALMVALGRSSMSQWLVSFNLISVTALATSFICGPRMAALAFSPAMDRTGIVNLVLAISAKSFAVRGHAAK